MVVEYAGCLECGTCIIACTHGAILWEYPKGNVGFNTGLDKRGEQRKESKKRRHR